MWCRWKPGRICILLLLLAACRDVPPGETTIPTQVVPSTSTATTIPTPNLAQTPEKTSEDAPQMRVTPTPWFPMSRFVAPSILPYDETETIWVLPVYACPGQSCLWLGDLEAGTAVQVTALSEDWQDCFVRGTVVQGWEVEGWVSCSRLTEAQPERSP